MGRWTGLSSFIDFHFENGHHHHHSHQKSFRSRMRLSTRYHKLDDSIFVFCRNCGNSVKSEERSKMAAAYAGSTPANLRPSNPRHFLTWSAAVANNRIQKLGKNFVNNVSRLHSKMERAMPAFHSGQEPSTAPPHNCSDQVENDLSEPNKDRHFSNQIHDSCRVSKVHKIPLTSAAQNNREKAAAECKTGNYLSSVAAAGGGEGVNCSKVDRGEGDANEERYSGFTLSTQCYRAQGTEIISNGDSNMSSSVVTGIPLGYASGNGGGGGGLMNSSSQLNNRRGGELANGITTTTTGPGFPHQIQSARIVQSHPFKHQQQDVVSSASTSSSTSSVRSSTPKSLVQSGHYKIPPNPTITAEALKAMIINSPTELNSCRSKYDDKPQPIKCVDVEVETMTSSDIKNMLELRTLHHENQSKYNLSCSSSGTSNSNNASMSDSSSSPLRNPQLPISSPQWSRTSSLSTCASTNAHNSQIQQQPVSILKSSLTNVTKDCDKRNNNNQNGIGRRSTSYNCSISSTNLDEIISQGFDNEGLTISEQQKPTVSFSSPVIESSDKASLLISGRKSFTKKGKSTKQNNNDKRSVAFQNPLSASSNRKHGSTVVVSPEAYPPSQLTVTIFEEEAELRHAPWFQAGIPRDIALEFLRNEPIGTFIVRESTTKAGCFALSLRVPKEFKRLGIAHYLILKSGKGYKIKGFTKEFKSLNSLITHHSVMPELLPCTLSLHRYRPNFPQKISRFNSNDFMEPEKLVGFTNFVDCLESS